MADIVIIGAGRLGTSLGRALVRKGHKVRALTCRRMKSAGESRAIIGQGRAMTDNAAAARRGRIILLCLPDEVIPRVASRLAESRVEWAGKTVFHTSGLLPARVLEGLSKKGAEVASLHPVQAFPSKKTQPSYFHGISFGLEGDRRALTLARGLVRQLGGRSVVIPEEAKPLYHAAFTFASNFLVILLEAAVGLLAQADIPPKKAARMLSPLLDGTLRNVKKLDAGGSLTGALVRGDTASVSAHLKALEPWPGLAEAYRKLSLIGLATARKSGLPPAKVRALKTLLEGR
jgi:predicted short-subunit dehydrogenase-like oxidoreductase (DUF2520 family)